MEIRYTNIFSVFDIKNEYNSRKIYIFVEKYVFLLTYVVKYELAIKLNFVIYIRLM